ncbi:SAM-dependent methyltransferase [Ramlibacter ginsenosidimutans]|uniref:SAM-dependent methyltransferase n=1 Tax=Ramlibacter ginsenosidimutans TaxID=502333 RepID=A0A934TT83_9BURK|nr:SAM-dependent methyltransferase [Ramlibacter ginsenosidimutans]MBK6006938.1 SAM-dependent methyltransferase [Ramlibacter ginsenosidimutans]
MAAGRLYLVPTPLDFGCDTQAPLAQVLPAGTIAVAARVTHWICENAKSARAFLKRVGEVQPLAAPLQQQDILELPREVHKKGDHAPASFDARPLLQAAVAGHELGLLSEAGMPAVADPGSSVVRAAHELGIEVVPLVGPVSLLLALAASGLNGQNFAFVGYLPQDAGQRAQRLRELEALAQRTGQTQMFIETPYRNAALWEALLNGLKPATRVAVASGLTLPTARCHTASASAWKQRPAPVRNDVPAVFALGA